MPKLTKFQDLKISLLCVSGLGPVLSWLWCSTDMFFRSCKHSRARVLNSQLIVGLSPGTALQLVQDPCPPCLPILKKTCVHHTGASQDPSVVLGLGLTIRKVEIMLEIILNGTLQLLRTCSNFSFGTVTLTAI